jgi:hypothetical protein
VISRHGHAERTTAIAEFRGYSSYIAMIAYNELIMDYLSKFPPADSGK